VTQLDIYATGEQFDAVKQVDTNGRETWSARELMPRLEYGADWRNFVDVISRAKAACANSGHAVQDHFVDANKMVRIGSGASRSVPDFTLTRYGAYLVAMNGDPRKPAVAAAQTYFAVKTREAEVAPARLNASEIDLNDLHAIARLGEAAQQAAMRAIAAEDRAERAEARADELEPAARNWEAVANNDGLSLRAFHKKWFSDVSERAFFEHLYAKDYLIDQRGKGGWSEKRQCYRDGSQHRHPGWRGKPYLELHTALDRYEVRRESARVRPGDPEIAFRDRLVKDGLPVNTTTDIAVRNA